MTTGDGALITRALSSLWHAVISRFALAPRYQGSTLLIWGGSLVIAFVVVVMIFRSSVIGDLALEAGPHGMRPRVHTRIRPIVVRARAPLDAPEDEYQLGRIAGRRAAPRTVDEALDAFVAAGLGEPRIVKSGPRSKSLRIHAARSANDGAACEFERGFLASAFEAMIKEPVTITEKRCACDGGGPCEYEVTY